MNNGPTEKHFFFYNSEHLSTLTTPTQSTRVLRHHYPAAEIMHTDVQTQNTLISTDNHSSTTRARNADFDETFTYSPYGNSPTGSNPALLTNFNGEMKYFSSLYALGQGRRFYSTAFMRFLSPDIMSPFIPGNLNSYCYCSGDPVNYFDPSGFMRASFKTPNPSPATKKIVKIPAGPHYQHTYDASETPAFKPMHGKATKGVLKNNAHPQSSRPPARSARDLEIDRLVALDPESSELSDAIYAQEQTVDNFRDRLVKEKLDELQSKNYTIEKNILTRLMTATNREVIANKEIRQDNDTRDLTKRKYRWIGFPEEK